MSNLSNLSVVDIFKGIIIDSLRKDGFISQPPPAEDSRNFFSKHKSILLTGTLAAVGGALLGPLAISSAVALLGFGEAGIAAGSIAAWMMSLHRGAVVAGSLVSILQSVGAAGLGIGGIIASGMGGGLFAGAIATAIGKILEKPEGLRELEDLVTITSEGEEPNIKVIFNIKQLFTSNEKLESFLKGFELAQPIIKTRANQFEFSWDDEKYEKYTEGINFLYTYLRDKYGIDHITSKQGSYLLRLNDQ